MARVSVKDVQDIVTVIAGANLTPFISMATSLTDKVVAKAVERNDPLTGLQARMVELNLAAYYYTHLDPQYTSRSSIQGAGAFKVQDYLEAACQLDTSGSLRILISRKKAGGGWLGTPVDCQTRTD